MTAVVPVNNALFWDVFHEVVNKEGKINWKEFTKIVIGKNKQKQKIDKKQWKEMAATYRKKYYYLLKSYKNYGLSNLGASCFLNVSIQSIASTPYLRESILKYEDEEIESKENERNLGDSNEEIHIATKLIKSLQTVFRVMLNQNEDKDDELLSLLEIVEELNDSIYVDGHNGAHQVLSSILEHLQILNPHFQAIIKMFYGKEMIKTKCQNCNHVKSNKECPISSVGIPIKANLETVPEMLLQHAQKEWMTGDNKPFCSRCQKKTIHTKQILLTSLPAILMVVIHQYNPNVVYHPCIDSEIDFSHNMFSEIGINKNEWKYMDSTTLQYKVNGIVLYDRYSETTKNDQGHYRTFQYDHYQKNWMYYDDDKYAPAQLSHVINNKDTYIVTYVAEKLLRGYKQYVGLQQHLNKTNIAQKPVPSKPTKSKLKNKNKDTKSKPSDISSQFDAFKVEMKDMDDSEKYTFLASKGNSMVTSLIVFCYSLKTLNDKNYPKLVVYDGEKKNTKMNKVKNLVHRYGM